MTNQVPRDEIRVALLYPLTGMEGAHVGQVALFGMRTAVGLARLRNGLQGWKVRLYPVDVQSADTAHREATRLLDEEHVGIIIGTNKSAFAVEASAVAAERGRIYLEANAAAGEITGRGSPLAFRLNSPPRDYALSAVDFPLEHLAPAWGIEPTALRVAALGSDSAFGRAVNAAIVARCRELGVPCVLDTVVSSAPGALEPAVARLIEAKPDVVYVSQSETAVLDQVAPLLTRVRPRALIGTGGWTRLTQTNWPVEAMEGILTADTPFRPSSNLASLSDEARSLEHIWQSALDAHMYHTSTDADCVFIAAMLLFGSVVAHSLSNEPHELAAAFRALDIPVGHTINGYGVRFDESGDNTRSFRAIAQWRDGRLVTVAPTFLATQPLDPRPPALARR